MVGVVADFEPCAAKRQELFFNQLSLESRLAHNHISHLQVQQAKGLHGHSSNVIVQDLTPGFFANGGALVNNASDTRTNFRLLRAVPPLIKKYLASFRTGHLSPGSSAARSCSLYLNISIHTEQRPYCNVEAGYHTQ